MLCEKCKGKTKVIDGCNTDQNERYRRRICLECGHIFYTVEFIVEEDDKFDYEWRRNYRRKPNKEPTKSTCFACGRKIPDGHIYCKKCDPKEYRL